MATERKLPEVGEEIHLPGPSAQPLMVAVTSTIALIGVTISTPIVFIVGITGLIVTLYQWIRDAVHEFKALPDHHGDHAHDDHGSHDDALHGYDEHAADETTSAASPASPELGKH